MQSSAWAAIIRHIPSEIQNLFMLVTAAGTEIAIASFLRVETEFVVIKGRLSGTQDTGRVFFIPYEGIDYIGYQKEVKDSEFEAHFKGLKIPEAEIEAAPVALVPVAPAPPVVPSRPSTSGTGMRSDVLDRFRARPNGAEKV